MSKVAIIGCGPTGLAACHELLSLGFEPRDILLIDSNAPESDESRPKSVIESLTVLGSFRSSSKNGPFKKPNSKNLMENDYGQSSSVPQSNAHVWGASCLPIPSWDCYANFERSDLTEKYATSIDRWGVHAEVDSLVEHFPVSSEKINQLIRKRLSNDFAIECQKRGIVGGHSRLAISNSEDNSCKYCGKCLQGCPNDVPWNPEQELRSLVRDYPNLGVLKNTVRRVLLEGKQPTVIFESGQKLSFEQIFLAAGWRQTIRIIDGEMSPKKTNSLMQSTVIMRAFYLDEPIEDESFYDSFSYHDSVLSIPPRSVSDNGFIAQIYFPTAELAGRIASNFPHFSHKAIEFILEREFKWNLNIFKRIGIAMIFSEGGKWTSNKNDIQEIESKTIPRIAEALHLIGGRVIPGARQTLDQGRSEHVGSWEPLRTFSLKLLNDDNRNTLVIPKILPIDTTLLPFVPPGPHTAVAASLSRIVVSEWMSR